ncbi:MAG: hypothetical protein ACI4V7_08620 [Succinivibrionaceae bacterium]
MVNSLFLALLLPTLPMEDIPNVPQNIILAHSYENKNPHLCIQINKNYLNYLYEENNYSKSNHFSNRIFALNSLISCEININNIKAAKEYFDIIKIIQRLANNPYAELLSKISEMKISAAENKSFTKPNLEKIIPTKQLTIDLKEDIQQISNVYQLANDYINKNYAKLTKFYIEDFDNKIKLDNASYIKYLIPNLYMGYSLSEKLELKSLHKKYFDLYITYLNSNNFNYTKAWVYSNLANDFYNKDIFIQAVYNQEIVISILEKIPEDKIFYIDELFKLLKYYKANNDESKALMLLSKLDYLIKSHYPNNYEKNIELAKNYVQIRMYKKALETIERISEVVKIDLSDNNSINNILYYAVACINTNKLKIANQILEYINPRYQSLPIEQKYFYNYVSTLYNLKDGNINDALNFIQKIPFEHLTIPPENLSITEQDLINKYKDFQSRQLFSRNNFDILKVIDNQNELYISISIFILIILILMLFSYHLNHKNKELKKTIFIYDEKDNFQNNNFDGNFFSYIINLNNAIEEFLVNGRLASSPSVAIKEFYHIYIPGFSNLNVKIGGEHTNQLLNIFKDKLYSNLDESDKVFSLADNRYIICKNTNNTSVNQSYSILLNKICNILTELQIDNTVIMGVINYPFPPHMQPNIKTPKIIEISLLSLAGAMDIYRHHHKSCWLKFIPTNINMENIHDSDLRIAIIHEIKRGNIKVISDNENQARDIDWNSLIIGIFTN